MLAMLIVPSSTAFLLSRRLPSMMAIGALLGLLSGAIGLYISFYWSVASGAAIVLVAIAFFFIALILSQRGRFLRRARDR